MKYWNEYFFTNLNYYALHDKSKVGHSTTCYNKVIIFFIIKIR